LIINIYKLIKNRKLFRMLLNLFVGSANFENHTRSIYVNSN